MIFCAIAVHLWSESRASAIIRFPDRVNLILCAEHQKETRISGTSAISSKRAGFFEHGASKDAAWRSFRFSNSTRICEPEDKWKRLVLRTEWKSIATSGQSGGRCRCTCRSGRTRGKTMQASHVAKRDRNSQRDPAGRSSASLNSRCLMSDWRQVFGSSPAKFYGSERAILLVTSQDEVASRRISGIRSALQS